MPALVGDLLQPLVCLRVHIGQIREGSQGPEVLAYIANRSLDFSFFPGCPQVARARNETVLASKAQKTRIKSHQVAFVFGNSRGQVVVPEPACDASHGLKGVYMATHEGLKALAVSKLQIHLAAVALDQA